jgi:hypothetical protein
MQCQRSRAELQLTWREDLCNGMYENRRFRENYPNETLSVRVLASDTASPIDNMRWDTTDCTIRNTAALRSMVGDKYLCV